MTTDLEVYEHDTAPVTLFGTNDPELLIVEATRRATALASVVEAKQLYKVIGNKRHVLVEAWTMLGSMLGVFAVLDGEPEPIEINGVAGWKAIIRAVTRDGATVGRAAAICLRSEAIWQAKDEFQLASMAQTRATSKALRQPLGFVMTLAGYEATPAEEMPNSGAPVNEPPATPADAGEPAATTPQLTKLHTVIGRLVEYGQDKEGLRDTILSEYGITSTKSLTKREAGEVIDKLERLLGEVSNGKEGTPFS